MSKNRGGTWVKDLNPPADPPLGVELPPASSHFVLVFPEVGGLRGCQECLRSHSGWYCKTVRVELPPLRKRDRMSKRCSTQAEVRKRQTSPLPCFPIFYKVDFCPHVLVDPPQIQADYGEKRHKESSGQMLLLKLEACYLNRCQRIMTFDTVASPCLFGSLPRIVIFII